MTRVSALLIAVVVAGACAGPAVVDDPEEAPPEAVAERIPTAGALESTAPVPQGFPANDDLAGWTARGRLLAEADLTEGKAELRYFGFPGGPRCDPLTGLLRRSQGCVSGPVLQAQQDGYNEVMVDAAVNGRVPHRVFDHRQLDIVFAFDALTTSWQSDAERFEISDPKLDVILPGGSVRLRAGGVHEDRWGNTSQIVDWIDAATGERARTLRVRLKGEPVALVADRRTLIHFEGDAKQRRRQIFCWDVATGELFQQIDVPRNFRGGPPDPPPEEPPPPFQRREER